MYMHLYDNHEMKFNLCEASQYLVCMMFVCFGALNLFSYCQIYLDYQGLIVGWGLVSVLKI